MNTRDPNGPPPDELDWADATLFYGTIETLEQLEQVAQLAVDTIRQSDSARLVVIEAWILLDYAVREFLLSGLGVKKLSTKDFDLRYKLLPGSFRICLDILKGLTKAQSALPPRPKVVNHRVRTSWSFLVFLEKEHPIDSERFRALEQEYYSKYHPELVDTSAAIVHPDVKYLLLGKPPPERSHINREWLKIAERLDDAWYSGANQLNDARNVAAHNYDQDQILGSMGCAGPDAMRHLKDRCANLIQTLVGVKKA
ncbi:hypothetical protein KAU37_11660 [Candidatus Bipolaricaulota bacterium]|nr:hypothetical protein [Candidatus Bipolaricaulota bacterium]